MIEKQCFLITGANSYLGRELANYLAKNQDNLVFLTSRTPFNFEELELQSNVKYLPNIDLLNERHLEKLKKEVDKFLPNKINILNSLGYFRAHEPFEETNLKEATKMIESQYLTLYGVVYTMLPLMKVRGGGHIIAFSCNSVKYRYPYMASFTASKAAIESFIGCIANEFGNIGILANSLALSSLQTPFVKASKPFGDFEHYLQLEDICKIVEEIVKSPFRLMNGNTISFYEHSDTFFNEGYYQRVRIK
jgi:short-subunit dehydrogenase